MDKVMILVIDGCAPEYLTRETAPNIFRLADESGFIKQIECAMPSVTNVNHACILSGKWPSETGVIGNYYYDPKSGREGFIEERGYMKAPTLLQQYKSKGEKTALLTVKGKILGVYGDGADIGINAQSPDTELLRRYRLGQPPSIQSVDVTEWIMNAAYQCIRLDDPSLVYCTTNDYVFHHFPPGSGEAAKQITAIDRYIGAIHALDPERQIYITADHGMNKKSTIIDIQRLSKRAGLDIYCLPPLKDRYIENHIYQEGGMLYVFLRDGESEDAFRAFARRLPQIDRILTNEEAAETYHLPKEQIGDFVLLSAADCAFGEVEEGILHTDESRTHGSLYERRIPLAAVNPCAPKGRYVYNKDIAALLMKTLS